MVMTEIDDKLLKEFFAEHKREVPDRGFSARVMRHLPGSRTHLTAVLTTCSLAVAVMLFFALDGFMAIIRFMREVFVAMVQQSAYSIDLRTMIPAAAVVIIFALHRIYTTE